MPVPTTETEDRLDDLEALTYDQQNISEIGQPLASLIPHDLQVDSVTAGAGGAFVVLTWANWSPTVEAYEIWMERPDGEQELVASVQNSPATFTVVVDESTPMIFAVRPKSGERSISFEHAPRTAAVIPAPVAGTLAPNSVGDSHLIHAGTDRIVIVNADILNLSANKLTAGTLNAAIINVINLDADEIVSGSLSADRISGGTIDASDIDVINLDADNITTGHLSADMINAGTMSANRISGGEFTGIEFSVEVSSQQYIALHDGGLEFVRNTPFGPVGGFSLSPSGAAGADMEVGGDIDCLRLRVQGNNLLDQATWLDADSDGLVLDGDTTVEGDLVVAGDVDAGNVGGGGGGGGGGEFYATERQMSNGEYTLRASTHGIDNPSCALATFIGNTRPNADNFVICRVESNDDVEVRCRDNTSNDFVNIVVFE